MNSCGHAATSDSTCQTCENSRKLIQENEPLSWVGKVHNNYRFTVLVFYRGKWCSRCQLYLQQIDPIVNQIRASGGEIFAVCAQRTEVVEATRQEWDLRYDLVADPKNVLGKKFNINVMKTRGKAFNQLIGYIKQHYTTKNELPEDNAVVAQPGLVVLNQDGSVLYSWKSEPCAKNYQGAINRINPSDVLQIVQFYFSNASIVESVKLYVQKNLYNTFITVLNDPEGTIAFTKHLQKEFNEESLEFIHDMDQLKSKKNDADKIYLSYIMGGAPKELNLPGSVRRLVDSEFKGGNKIDALLPAYEHVKITLSADSFNRFVQTQEFVKVATRIIPQCFTSEVIDEICYV
jgi:peroxiredoxin